jgi:hypothetical protein
MPTSEQIEKAAASMLRANSTFGEYFTLKEVRNLAKAALFAAEGVGVKPENDYQLIEELTGALRFIMAFYVPGQTYLDTNAWTQAEAGGKRALAKGEARILSALTPEKETP